MAYGMEYIFGYPNKEEFFASGLVGPDFVLTEDGDLDGMKYHELNRKLHNLTRTIINEYGWKILKEDDEDSSSYLRHIFVETEFGVRELSPLWFSSNLAEYATDDDILEDIHFGISLTGRYYPRLLDIESEYGGKEQFVFDRNWELRKDTAITIIKSICPELTNATTYVNMKYY